jgi:ribonucleoside-diphosphate reductase beta chain
MPATREAFTTTRAEGLRHDSLPMRLYHKAKRLGAWDPRAIDLTRDIEDWERLTYEQRVSLLQVTSLFQAGEESVTLDLLPLIQVIAVEGRLEEEMFLTTFLWEEAKHVEFFRRFLDEVCHVDRDLHGFHTPSYRRLFYEELPEAMHRLLRDPSPEAQVDAAVTYTMIVEGVLAETGYHTYVTSLERADLFPGLRRGLALVKRDESRHIAYGVYLLSRLVAEDASLWPRVRQRMEELLEPAIASIRETFASSESELTPFGIPIEEILAFATTQFRKRMDRIERGKAARTVSAVEQLASEELATEA